MVRRCLGAACLKFAGRSEQRRKTRPTKIKLICEDVQGYNCLTNFHRMGMTRDKPRFIDQEVAPL